MSDTTRYLNLGCGSRYHPDWINIDIAPQNPQIIRHDFSRGIPLADSSCDVVYHAAVLEHVRRSDAPAFLAECYRVLKPGGIVRVGVPDLEKICQLYLCTLASAQNGVDTAAHDYDWMMLELLDQAVRENGGGDMLNYLRQTPLPNEAFVFERIGEEGRRLAKALRRSEKHTGHSLQIWLHKLPQKCRALPGVIRRRMVLWLLGSEDARALAIGRFRLAGEVHQWMYDRYSLAQSLIAAGFRNPQFQEADTSGIPNWTNYHLDTLPDGTPFKPDLFFMEAIKPEVAVDD